jgi:hypothetical protein
MTSFVVIETDKILQVNDKIRIDLSKSYTSFGDEITKIEIEPYEDAGFIDISSKKKLDYQYVDSGIKTIKARAFLGEEPMGEDPDPWPMVESELTILVLSEEQDNLFCDDQDIKRVKTDVLRFLDYRTSFKFYHREAQSQILEWLKVNGYFKYNREPYVKEDISDIDEVRLWATYLSLSLIMKDQSNSIDDVFDKLSREYEGRASEFRDSVLIRLGERPEDLRTKSLIRR